MPIYSFYHGDHKTERHASITKIPKRVKCEICKKAWAKLGMSYNLDSFVRGRAMNDKTRKDFRHLVTRDQYRQMSTTRDVDAAFADFSRRYPHLRPPGPMRRDPDASVSITESRKTHGEGGIE